MMRTKHILTAMVLPALFAACTADEIDENSDFKLGNRALLSPVTFTVGQDAETRFAWNESGYGNWKWEATDAFSAFLVDGVTLGTVNDVLATNYIYKQNAATTGYETTSQMVEGTYWFYAPAPQDKNTRDLIPFKLDIAQDAEYYKSDAAKVFVTPLYQLTKEDSPSNIDLNLFNYYSRAVFPLTNNTDEAVKINQIILEAATGTPFDVEGEISVLAVNGCKYGFQEDGTMVSVKNLNDDEEDDETVAKLKERFQALDMVKDNNKKKAVSTLVLNLGGKSIAAGATETFTMLVPRTDANVSCNVKIITDKGLIEITTANASNYAKNVQFKHNGIMPIFGLKSDASFKSFSIEEEKFTDMDGARYVSTYEDMIELINTINGSFTVYNIGEWSLDAAMATAIKNSDSYVTFTQPITIADEAKAVELTKVAFNGAVTIEAGTEVTFKTGAVGTTTAKTNLAVESGATLSIEGGNFNDAIITNKGALTVKDGADMSGEEGHVAAITSTGVLTLEDNGSSVLTINAGTLNLTTAKTEGAAPRARYEGSKITLPTNATLAANITINVAENVELTVDGNMEMTTRKVNKTTYNVSLVNNGDVKVKDGKTLTVKGGLTNNGTVTDDSNDVLSVYGTANTNNGTISAAMTVNADAAVANNGKIESVVNNGTITTSAKSRTTVGASIAGVIDNTAKAYLAGTLTQQTVVYKVTEALNAEGYGDLNDATLVGTYKINKLVFSNELNVDADITVNAGIKAIDFNKGASVWVAAGKKLALGASATAVGINANVTFEGFDDGAEITFAKASTITVSHDCTLTINYVKVTGANENVLTFVSTPAEAGNDNSKAGQVKNNGSVRFAAQAYASGVTYPWWTGTAALQN